MEETECHHFVWKSNLQSAQREHDKKFKALFIKKKDSLF